MAIERWARKAQALVRLAEDQRGKPEGELARQKLLEIIAKHPEAAHYEPIIELAQRDEEWLFTMGHLRAMKMAGISTDGKWEGRTLTEALRAMVTDYKERLTGKWAMPASGDVKRIRAYEETK